MASHGGDLQAALNALPQSGGTLYLRNGNYGRVDVLERSNIHLRGESKAGVRLQGIRIVSCPELLDYGVANLALDRRDPRIIGCLTDRHRNFSISNLTLDGGGVDALWDLDDHYSPLGALLVRAVTDVLVEDVDVVNYTQSDTGDVHPVYMANVLVDGWWSRRVHINVDSYFQYFTDGCHGCGILDSTIGHGRSGGIMFYVNDDWTDDRFPEDGTYSDAEKRLSNYTVVKGNTIVSNNAFAIGHQGAHALIEGNTSTGFHREFVKFDTRGNSNHPGEYRYRHVGHRVRGNTVRQAFRIVTWHAGGADAEWGDFAITDNRVVDPSRYDERGGDANRDGVAYEGLDPAGAVQPAVVRDNCIGC